MTQTSTLLLVLHRKSLSFLCTSCARMRRNTTEDRLCTVSDENVSKSLTDMAFFKFGL